MERNANYAVVGLISLALFVGLIVFVVWLARLSFNQDYDNYDVIFQGPVRGLTQGGEVHFNGIKVGEVTKIALDKADPNRVIATTRMTSDVPVRVDSIATLEPYGITGVNYIQITAGTPSKPLLKDVTPKDQTPVIKSARSALSDLLEGGGTVLSRTVEALDRVNRVLSEENIQHFGATLDNVEQVTAELNSRKALFAQAEQALQSFDAAAKQFDRLAATGNDMLDGDGRRTLRELADAAAELKAAAADARTLVNNLEGPTSDFATTGLPQLTAAIATLQQAASSLDRLVGQVESNPQSLIGKAPDKEIEVKP